LSNSTFAQLIQYMGVLCTDMLNTFQHRCNYIRLNTMYLSAFSISCTWTDGPVITILTPSTHTKLYVLSVDIAITFIVCLETTITAGPDGYPWEFQNFPDDFMVFFVPPVQARSIMYHIKYFDFLKNFHF
jgi:hypothetical protein